MLIKLPCIVAAKFSKQLFLVHKHVCRLTLPDIFAEVLPGQEIQYPV